MASIKTILKNTTVAGRYLREVAKQRRANVTRYELAFNREENNCWYIDLPEWQGSHGSLQMVAGADTLLEFVGKGAPRVEAEVCKCSELIPELDDDAAYFRADMIGGGVFGGATYQVNLSGFNDTMWLCPVTLFVMGEYPKHIYIKVTSDK